MKKIIPIVVLIVVVGCAGGFWIGTHNSRSANTTITIDTTSQDTEVHKIDYGYCAAEKQRRERGEKPILRIDPKDDPCKDYK